MKKLLSFVNGILLALWILGIWASANTNHFWGVAAIVVGGALCQFTLNRIGGRNENI